MKKCIYTTLIFICMCIFLSGCSHFFGKNQKGTESIEYLSPVSIAVDRNNTTVYIADATAKKISVFDIKTKRVKHVISLNKRPCGLTLSPDESSLFVSSGSSDGRVEIIDLEKYVISGTIDVGHTPCSPVISPESDKIFVPSRFGNYVSVIDVAGKREIAKIPMMREPVACALTPDGKYLYVANHLPTNRQIDEYVVDGGYMDIKGYSYNSMYSAKSVVVVVDAETYKLTAIIQLPKGANALRGICVSPDGKHAYVTHILAQYLVPTEKIENGSINKNALSVIDAKEMEYIDTVALDDIDLGASNPWGVKCSPDGEFICVAHAGTHEISVINRGALHAKLERKNSRGIPWEISQISYASDDLDFLRGIRRRIHLKGNGPRGIAVTGKNIFAAEYFSDSLGLIDLYSGETPDVKSFALGPAQPLTPARKGEKYFNDADLCFQKWQSCASCHPDGRQDGLTWDLLNDGTGNPKSTKNLLLSHKTPPSMITGIRASGEISVRAGIKHILFTERPENEALAIDAYLISMKKVPSPHLVNGKLNKEAKRGRRIFKKAGCVECHPAPYYTDMKKYDVGTGWGAEKNIEFDTPTLIEMWRTGPYLYDGRADSMFKVLRTYNRRDSHGKTLKLNLYEINDLNEFILSL
ncbi:cell surface protein [Candidatus Latescibacterota bacterium]